MNWALVLYILIALVPGLYSWASGRRLSKRLDDPALAELNFRRTKRQTWVLLIAVALLAVFSSGALGLGTLIAVFGLLAGAFPLRKKLLGEQWGFFSCLFHQFRVLIAFGGPWFLVACAVAILYRAEGLRLPLALVLAVVVVSWFLATAWLAPRLLNGKPLSQEEQEDRGLTQPFEKILSAAECPRPHLVRLPWGGRVTNAFALSSAGTRGTVAFTEGLLEALSPPQSAAILGHELAHLEHTGRRKMLFAAARLALLVALAGGVTWIFPAEVGYRSSASLIWCFAVLLSLGISIASRKKHERESDLRAIALGAAPEDLIEALTILHRRLVIPRQLDEQTESSSSHPSLARRIQAIRQAAGVKDEVLEPILVRSGDEAVLLEEDRLSWLGGMPDGPLTEAPRDIARTVTSVSYPEIRSLLLSPGHRGMILRSVEEKGKKRSLLLAPEDVERVQQALRQVDHRLGGSDVGSTAFSSVSRSPLRRFSAAIGVILGLVPGVPWAAFLGSLLVLIRPSRVTLAAGAVTSLGGALWLFFERRLMGESLEPISLETALVLLTFLFLIFLLPVIRKEPKSERGRNGLRLTLGVFAVAIGICLIGLAGFLSGPLTKTGLYLWARSMPTFSLSLLAMAATVLLASRRRWLAVAALLPAGAALFLGSPSFGDRWTDDPFRHHGPALQLEEGLLQPERSHTFEDQPANLLLSPGGQRLAVQPFSRDYDGELAYREESPEAFQVEQKGGSFLTLEALGMGFVDDEHLLALQEEGGDLTLRLLPAEGLGQEPGASPLWSLPLQRLAMSRLTNTGEHWQLVGTRQRELIESSEGRIDDGSAARRILCLSGTVGTEEVHTEEWTIPMEVDSSFTQWWAGSGLGVLDRTYDWPDLGSWASFMVMMVSPYEHSEVRWWPRGTQPTPTVYRSIETLLIKPPSPGEKEFHWLVANDDKTTIWRLHPGQEPEALGWIPGNAHGLVDAGEGRLLLQSHWASTLFDPETGKSVRLVLANSADDGEDDNEETALRGGVSAASSSHAAESTTDWKTGVTTVQIYSWSPTSES